MRPHERNPWYWLAWAIVAEEQAVRLVRLDRDEVRRVLASQNPRDVLDAAQGTATRLLVEKLDAERDGAPIDLAFRRSLRELRSALM